MRFPRTVYDFHPWVKRGQEVRTNCRRFLGTVEGQSARKGRALRSIAQSAWGGSLEGMCKLYQAIKVPKLLYACSVCAPLQRGRGWATAFKKMVLKLSMLQKEAIAAETGALRCTASLALEVETNIPPIQQRLAKLIYGTVNRIRCSPVYDKILEIRRPSRPPKGRPKVK